MKPAILDVVILNRDIPEFGLKAGDAGTVVETYEPDGLEVEFVTGSGATQALVTLHADDVHLLSDREILAARQLDVA